VCIYLTLDEARELEIEARVAEELSNDVPLLANLVDRLNAAQYAQPGSQV
jgi:hypothetical protein